MGESQTTRRSVITKVVSEKNNKHSLDLRHNSRVQF